MSDTEAHRVGRPRTGDVPEQLLSAATRLFAERGFDGTSVQAIVEAAGVTKGGMYHYFDSKEDLLYEIYGRLLRLQMQHLREYAESDLPLVDKVHAVAKDVVTTSLEDLDGSVIFFRSLHQLSAEKQALVRAERREYHVLVRSLIAEGMDSGVFARRASPEMVIDFFYGAVHHVGTWYHRDGSRTPAQIGQDFADLLLAGLRP